jgi:hypothetical protein
MNSLNYHYTAACEEALRLVKIEALRILQRPGYKSFVLVMGFAGFEKENGIENSLDTKGACKLNSIIDEWDPYLRLTGAGIKMLSNGSVFTDW